MSTPTPKPSPSATPPASEVPDESPPQGREPAPSSGTSPEPDYKPTPPATEWDGRPSDKRRKWEREQLKPAAPSANGGFDIKTGHVYYTSALIRDEQFNFHKAATHLVDSIGGWGQTQVAGRGHGADAFADAYADVAERCLRLWSKCIDSIGGVAVGLTETANNYLRADWASRQANRRHQIEAPPLRPPPIGVGKVTYGPASSIKWTGTGDDSGPLLAWAGNGPDWLAEQIDEAIEHVLRLGKTVEVTPGPWTDDLRAIGDAWELAGKDAKKCAGNFIATISYLTDSSNSEWQGAMNAFCQSIWGTTAWGQNRYEDGATVPRGSSDGREWRTNPRVSPGTRRPIIEILEKTGTGIRDAFHGAANAADKSKATTSRLAKEAADATLKDLTIGLDLGELTRLGATLAFGEITATFASHMDKAGADAAVDAQHAAFHSAAAEIRALLPELDEALLSAPTFEAEEARAHAFGARALDEFRPRHRWTQPGHTDLGIYQIDLASTEWLENSHTAARHVGLTDEQLAQRLRDDLKKGPRPGSNWPYGQPFPAFASTFSDMDTAQRVTQYNIDEHAGEIRDWIDSDPPPEKGDSQEFISESTPYGENGRSIDRQHMKREPESDREAMEFPAQKAVGTYGVKTKIVYNEDLDPPFVVMTSMPVVGARS
ncbi:RNase A-like domain-containing protein [Streptomyces sp. NPDC006283]|uniref:RNase A-like domain-containing protein n=1 Tax=Streptomyces sp. NPDC006283 TaxID=3156741 RepID=UPI0033A308C1